MYVHSDGKSGGFRRGLVTAAVEVAHDDASESYTAHCWIPAGSDDGAQCLVLGCASGRVQAWDPSAGEMIGPPAEAFRSIAQGADCAVLGLAASSPGRGTVFAACGGTPEILEVGLADGSTRSSFRAGKTGLCRLAAAMARKSGHNQEWLMSAAPGSVLKVWKLPAAGATLGTSPETMKAHLRLAAPANPATGIDLACIGGRVLALSADGTMQLDFFDVGPEGGSSQEAKGRQPPMASARVLSCHERLHSARLARTASAGGSSGRLLVVGFGSTIVACWAFDVSLGSDGAANRTVAPAFTVSQTELGGKVLCARHDALGAAAIGVNSTPADKLALVIAYGPSAKPVFVQVRAPKAKGGTVRVEPISGEALKKNLAALGDAKVAERTASS
ncbi:unnamed protein product, partial [Polarella glacialis]